MAGTLKPFNSVAGFSVGTTTQTTIIDANGNVFANALSFEGNLNGNLSTSTISANVLVANYIGNATTVLTGDGGNITGLPAAYGNAEVANYLPTFSGNLGNVTEISAVGNITALGYIFADGNVVANTGAFLVGDGGYISNITVSAGSEILNGTSNVNIPDPDGNVVIGVDNDAMNWTFATDGIIYGKSDTTVTITAQDTADSGYTVSQVVTDGSVPQAQTELNNYSFKISTDLTGTNSTWSFQNNYLYTPQNAPGIFQGFNSDVIVQAMQAGGNPVASLQSVSSVNDPNIFSTFDATVSGANIKVYNGGSNSGVEYAWKFDNTGNLTLPSNTFAVNYANGDPVVLGGGVQAEIANGTSNVTIPTSGDNVYVNVDGGGGTLVWAFGSDGVLRATGGANFGYFIGDGANLSNITAANVVGNLDNANLGNIVANGTITATGFTTTGSGGNIYGANVITANTVIANTIGAAGTTYLYGDGSNITGLPAGYSNADVANYLPTYTGNIDLVSSVGNALTVLNGNGASITNVNAVTVTNGSSNVAIPVTNGNVVVTVNGGNTWTFGTDGQLTGAGNVSANVLYGNFSGSLASQLLTNGYNISGGSFDWSSLSIGAGGGGHRANLNSLGGVSAFINTGAAGTVNNTFEFGTDGNFTIPASGYVLTQNISGANVTVTASGANGLVALVPGGPNGYVTVSNAIISNVAEPNVSTDAATKGYVDAHASGLVVKTAVTLASVAALPAYTFTPGGTPGVGDTIVSNTNVALVLDGVTATSASRVLIKDETAGNAPYNGIYVVTAAGDGSNPFVLTRATDFNSASNMPGAYCLVTGGNTLASTGWTLSTPAPIVVDTTALSFTQFSSTTAYTGGNAINVTGTTISLLYSTATLDVTVGNELFVADSAQFVTPDLGNATGTSVTLTGTANVGALIVDTGSANVMLGNVNVVAGSVNIVDTSLTSNVVQTTTTSPTVIFTGTAGKSYEVTVQGSDGTGNIVLSKVLVTYGGDYMVYGTATTGAYLGSISASATANVVTVSVTAATATSCNWTYFATGL